MFEGWFLSLIVTMLLGFKIFTSKNPITALFLFMFFIMNMSLRLFCLNIASFAFILLIIYVGAIMVLFTFVVMLLNIKVYERSTNIYIHIPVFICVFAGILSIGWSERVVLDKHLIDYINGFNYISWVDQMDDLDNISVVGIMLFTESWFVTFLLGYLLLIAIVGSVILTYNNMFERKKQEMYKQTARDFNEILKFKTKKWD